MKILSFLINNQIQCITWYVISGAYKGRGRAKGANVPIGKFLGGAKYSNFYY
jgi:hypothetical protein